MKNFDELDESFNIQLDSEIPKNQREYSRGDKRRNMSQVVDDFAQSRISSQSSQTDEKSIEKASNRDQSIQDLLRSAELKHELLRKKSERSNREDSIKEDSNALARNSGEKSEIGKREDLKDEVGEEEGLSEDLIEDIPLYESKVVRSVEVSPTSRKVEKSGSELQNDREQSKSRAKSKENKECLLGSPNPEKDWKIAAGLKDCLTSKSKEEFADDFCGEEEKLGGSRNRGRSGRASESSVEFTLRRTEGAFRGRLEGDEMGWMERVRGCLFSIRKNTRVTQFVAGENCPTITSVVKWNQELSERVAQLKTQLANANEQASRRKSIPKPRLSRSYVVDSATKIANQLRAGAQMIENLEAESRRLDRQLSFEASAGHIGELTLKVSDAKEAIKVAQNQVHLAQVRNKKAELRGQHEPSRAKLIKSLMLEISFHFNLIKTTKLAIEKLRNSAVKLSESGEKTPVFYRRSRTPQLPSSTALPPVAFPKPLRSSRFSLAKIVTKMNHMPPPAPAPPNQFSFAKSVEESFSSRDSALKPRPIISNARKDPPVDLPQADAELDLILGLKNASSAHFTPLPPPNPQNKENSLQVEYGRIETQRLRIADDDFDFLN